MSVEFPQEKHVKQKAGWKEIPRGGDIRAGSSMLNKTGSWRTFKPRITDKCVGCGICVRACPEGAIELKEVNGKKRAVVNYTYCKGCMICAMECPQKAIVKEREK